MFGKTELDPKIRNMYEDAGFGRVEEGTPGEGESFQLIPNKVYTAKEVFNLQGAGAEKAIYDTPAGYELKQIYVNELDIPFRSDLVESFGEHSNIEIDKQKSKLSENLDALPPIVLGKDNHIVDGGHRVVAHYELGHEMVDAFVPAETDESFQLSPKSLSNQKYATLKGFVKQLAQEGEPARYWYEQSGQALLDITDGDVDQAKKLLSIIAITSPQMDVKTNFGQMVKGYYKSIRGDEPLAGRFPGKMSEKIQKVMDGQEWEGLKTDKFYKNLVAVIEGGTPDVTVDMWMMRAFGIDKDNPTDLEYRKIEKLVQDIGTELEWEPYQVQAAIWTSTKARWESIHNGLLKKAKKAGIYLGDGKWKMSRQERTLESVYLKK